MIFKSVSQINFSNECKKIKINYIGYEQSKNGFLREKKMSNLIYMNWQHLLRLVRRLQTPRVVRNVSPIHFDI